SQTWRSCDTWWWAMLSTSRAPKTPSGWSEKRRRGSQKRPGRSNNHGVCSRRIAAMCFSPEASFLAGAALLPAGCYCVQSAFRKDLRYLPLAVVPVAFGVQQWSEGVVWLGLQGNDPTLITQASVFFLFFAVAFWPFWIPFSLLVPETRG